MEECLMKYVFFTLAAAAMLAASQGYAATLSASYGWEDGTGTILGSYGNLADPANVTTGDELSNSTTIYEGVTPNTGDRMLTVSESPHYSTPQAYLAYIEGLSEGDAVTASFYGWDSTSGVSPSLRIWGHWALNGDVDSFTVSASGSDTYTEGGDGAWSQVSYTWTVPAGQEALVVEGRLYSTPATADPATTTYFIDDLAVEASFGDGAGRITTPGGTTEITVPEPSTIVLCGLALACLGLARQRD
jgi:hypothetical protein